jgi:hypothetical protein
MRYSVPGTRTFATVTTPWGKACARWEYLLNTVLDDGSGLLRYVALVADFGTTSVGFVVGCVGSVRMRTPAHG